MWSIVDESDDNYPLFSMLVRWYIAALAVGSEDIHLH